LHHLEEKKCIGPVANGKSDCSEPATGGGITHLVRRIIDRLSRMTAPDFAQVEGGDETAWKLRGLAAAFSEADTSGRVGHRWPASGLTADDMCKLRILSNLTGVPGTELLHAAVGLLFEQTRDATDRLLRDAETHTPCLDTAADIETSGVDPTTEASAVAGSGSTETPIPQVTPNCSTAIQSHSSTLSSSEQANAEPVIVAESSPESSNGTRKQQRLF